MEHPVLAEGVRRLVVHLHGGGVTLSDSGGTHVEGTVTAAREPRIRQHDSWLTIQATRQEADILLAVPARIDVQIRTRTGDVTATVALGNVSVGSGSGDLRLDTVTGALDAYSDAGDLDLTALDGEGRLRSGSGDITLGRLTGALHIRNGSGDVTVASNRGDLVVHVGSGDVSVGVPPNTPTWLDLHSSAGEVSVLLPERGPADEDAEDHASISATTGSGSIRIVSA